MPSGHLQAFSRRQKILRESFRVNHMPPLAVRVAGTYGPPSALLVVRLPRRARISSSEQAGRTPIAETEMVRKSFRVKHMPSRVVHHESITHGLANTIRSPLRSWNGSAGFILKEASESVPTLVDRSETELLNSSQHRLWLG